MRVLVTRPAAQAESWVQSLAQHGVDAVALPLIDIRPARAEDGVQSAWQRLGEHRLVVFVSPNAAEQFFAARPPALAWPVQTLAGSVGPGTSDVLMRLGVPADRIVEPARASAQFDSEALWQRLSDQDWQGASVLIVRGDGGRDWLAQTLQQHGATVSFVTAYRRAAPAPQDLSPGVLEHALADSAGHLWFFSSSEAIDNLVHLCPGASWARARAVATHPRIAARARDCGFGVVHECRPTLDAVVHCIQSIAS